MEALLNNFYSNFFFYFCALVSICAAFSFLIYLRGFIAGVGHVFDDGAHVEHQGHANVRAVWGALLLFWFFNAWEYIRLALNLFSGTPINGGFYGMLVLIDIVWLALFLRFKPKGGGGH